MRRQAGEKRVRQVERRDPQALGGSVEKMPSQHGNVVGPLAQRRNVQFHHGQAPVQILAERAACHLGFQIAVTGRQHAHVDVARPILAHCSNLAFLQGPQQHPLQRQRQLAHFVEQHSATVGLAEQTGARPHRAGESAAHVTKQLGLGQFSGQRGTVEAHKRLGRAPRRPHDGFGQAFLAGATLAGDQHGAVARGHPAHQHGQRAHGLGNEDQGARKRQLTAQPLVLQRQTRRLGGSLDHRDQLVSLKGLAEVVVRTGLHGLHRLAFRTVGGYHHHPRGWVLRHELAQKFHSVHARHTQIGHHQLRRCKLQAFQGLDPVTCDVHLQARRFQDLAQRIANASVVVDHQHTRLQHGAPPRNVFRSA